MQQRAVVYLHELWSVSRLVAYSFLSGVTVYTGIIVLMMVQIFAQHGELPVFLQKYQKLWLVPGAVIVATSPWFLLWRFQSMIRTYKRAMASGVACGFGATSLVFLFAIGNPDLNYWLGLIGATGAAGVFYGLSNFGLMALFNRLRHPLPIQDGTLCPGCSYSLVGNVSMVCPECGRPYYPAEISPRPIRNCSTPSSGRKRSRGFGGGWSR